MRSKAELHSAEEAFFTRGWDILPEQEVERFLDDLTTWQQSSVQGAGRIFTRPLPEIARNFTVEELDITTLERNGDWPFRRIEIISAGSPRPSDIISMIRTELAIYECFPDDVTFREYQVLQHCCSSQETIAHVLGVGTSTVRTHIGSLGKKLDSHSHCELIPAAMHAGLTPITRLTGLERDRLSRLTPRQREVAAYSVLQYEGIAERLDIDPLTVRSHLHDVYVTTGVSSKAELVGLMMRMHYGQRS